MGISNIWVFSQESNGTATSGTLELLTHARTLGGSVTAFVGGDASAIAGILGEYGATKVYATGDLGGALPGAAVASAMKAVIDGGDSPDLILFPQNYEGRDVMSRLSVKVDRTVLTNNVAVAVDGDTVTVTTPVFGGNTLVSTSF
ncbi:MAG: electron transfer flavoprotein subunit alpha/FixB family protein, partial [Actinobacteria bacterium]|nr:electron transfer flavoprotein subunit alpha/FixB family protein [Actinomycetota bacterium]